MRINSKDKLGGQPILDARQMLRKRDYWTVPLAAWFLRVSKPRAKRFMQALEAEGYVQPGQPPDGEPCWFITQKGSTLACATAARPLLRATAEKQLAEFLKRVEEVRDNPWFLYRVAKAYVFGSYLSDADTLGDIDIAVELVPKEKDPEEQKSREWEKLVEVMDQGKELNIVEQRFWSRLEVERHLKFRSRISLHPLDDIAIDPRAKLIYEDRA
jgi:predicted nucleotidyltransferase